MKILPKSKKGGIVTDVVQGTGGLIIGVVIVLVIITTLLGANLLGTGTVENTTAYDMSSNFTEGLNNISEKIPTILLIAAVVLLFGVLVLLVAKSRQMGIGGGASL
jgi:hypothetical protein